MTAAPLGIDPTPEEFAEAAAWIARLHGPQRTLQTDKGFHRWLAAKPAHAAAFEAMSAAWDVTGRIPKQPFPRVSRWQRAGYRHGFVWSAVAVAGVAALAIGITLYLRHAGGVSTGIGEQRTLTLEDGTRVWLNTSTRIVVSYDDKVRKIEFKNGEALFDVSKRSDRPFIVEVRDQQVRALGTEFIVRRDAGELAVTLVEGKVSVAPLAASSQAGAAPSLLTPGQRMIIPEHSPPRIDQPAIDKATAWRRGLVDFENTRLGEAVVEMNRYSVARLVVETPEAFNIPITGVFRAGDASSFAAAVARAYGLQVSENGSEIRLTGSPAHRAAQ